MNDCIDCGTPGLMDGLETLKQDGWRTDPDDKDWERFICPRCLTMRWYIFGYEKTKMIEEQLSGKVKVDPPGMRRYLAATLSCRLDLLDCSVNGD